MFLFATVWWGRRTLILKGLTCQKYYTQLIHTWLHFTTALAWLRRLVAGLSPRRWIVWHWDMLSPSSVSPVIISPTWLCLLMYHHWWYERQACWWPQFRDIISPHRREQRTLPPLTCTAAVRAWRRHTTHPCVCYVSVFACCSLILAWKYSSSAPWITSALKKLPVAQLTTANMRKEEDCVQSGGGADCFRHQSPWWGTQQSSLKRRSISTRLHGAAYQKTVVFIILASARTWNLTMNRMDPLHTFTRFWRSMLIVSSHLHIGLPSDLFPSVL
jgi:hypothetical protein